MDKGSNDYEYSYENIDYQNDDSSFELTQEAKDFLSVIPINDSDGNVVYIDGNGNKITEEQYKELYEKFVASLDDETREGMEAFIASKNSD